MMLEVGLVAWMVVDGLYARAHKNRDTERWLRYEDWSCSINVLLFGGFALTHDGFWAWAFGSYAVTQMLNLLALSSRTLRALITHAASGDRGRCRAAEGAEGRLQ